MSYEIELRNDAGGIVTVDTHQAGGTVAVGGSSVAEMSSSYNFSYFYYNEIDEDEGLRWLDGKKASETIDVLEEAVDTLGDEPHRDCQNYWCPSMGNAGRDLATMLEWAKQHPDAEWVII